MPPATPDIRTWTVGRPCIRVSRTSSTMDLASDLARRGALPGTAVLAGFQSAGRGRGDREWVAPPWSSVLLSFIWHTAREREALGAASLLLGLAVADTVDTLTGRSSTIKWPNDVLVRGRKVAGILVRNQVISGDVSSTLICGMGINVSTPASDLPVTATSLAIETDSSWSVDDVLPVLFAHLDTIVARFEADRIGGEWDRLHARLAFRNEQVCIQDDPRLVEGTLRGVARDGALLLETSPGKLRRVVAGDLTRGPRPGNSNRG